MRAALDAIVPDVAKGVRAAVATIVPFYLAGELHRPELVWVALGGWLGSLVDPGGARSSRAMGVFSFAAIGGLASAVAEAAAHEPWLAGTVLTLFAFATSMLRAAGGFGANFGAILLIGVAVAASYTRGAPLRDGLAFFVGASWAMLLSSVVWPVWTHRPVRRAIGNVFDALADYASAIQASSQADASRGSRDEIWGATARQHQRIIRAAIEEARQVAVASRTRRSGESRLGSNLRLLLGNAELTFFALIAISEEVEVLPSKAARADSERDLERLARTYREVRDWLFMRKAIPRTQGAVPEAAPSLARGLPSKSGHEAPAARLARRLGELARVALRVAREPDRVIAGEQDPEDAPHTTPSLRRVWREGFEDVRDAFSLKSPTFQHAVRVTVMVAVAFAVGKHVSPTHSSWVTITAIAVLQPYPGAAVRRAAERVVGTAFGSVAAVMLMIALHSPLALALAMFPLSTAAVVTRPRSYRLFTFFLTPVFVLVADRLQPSWWTAAARAGDSVLGGALALMFALLIFPSREERRLADALGAVVDALGRYATIMFELVDPACPPPHADGGARQTAARRTMGIMLGNAETSLERMLAEPKSFRRGAEDAVQLMTYMRRLSGALTALDLSFGPHGPGAAHRDLLDAGAIHVLRDYVTAVLAAVGRFVREGVRAPMLRPPAIDSGDLGQALARVLLHAELLATLIARETHAAPDGTNFVFHEVHETR